MKTINLSLIAGVISFSTMGLPRIAYASGAGGGYDHNFDREVDGTGIKCNGATIGELGRTGYQGFGLEAPVAKVVGDKLNLSFYATTYICIRLGDGSYGWDAAVPKHMDRVLAKAIVDLTRIPEDLKLFTYRIDRSLVYNLVTYEMPLENIMEKDQLDLYKQGKNAVVKFRIYNAYGLDRGGFYKLNLTLNQIFN